MIKSGEGNPRSGSLPAATTTPTPTASPEVARRPAPPSRSLDRAGRPASRSTERGAEGTRTPDPLHAMQVRYQLRHNPMRLPCIRFRTTGPRPILPASRQRYGVPTCCLPGGWRARNPVGRGPADGGCICCGSGEEGIRTPDPRDANAVLYQLSYNPKRHSFDPVGARRCTCRPLLPGAGISVTWRGHFPPALPRPINSARLVSFVNARSGDGENRTPDILIANQVLYQLSYDPNESGSCPRPWTRSASSSGWWHR